MALHRPTTKLPASPLHFDRVCMSLLVMSCECPVCHAVVNPPTKMCLNGHLSCMGCVLDKPSCPECQERFTCARLSVVEQMLKIVGRACPHARHGCLTFLDSQRLLDHEPYCGWRRVQCPWCSSELGVNKWAEHVVKKHGFLALCYEAEGLMTIPISADHNKSLFYVNGVMFCMFIKFAGRRAGPLYLTFQCFPTSKEDMETVFEVRLEDKGLHFCQSIHPISDAVKRSDVFKNINNCIMIPYYLWKQKECFYFKITMPSDFKKDIYTCPKIS